MYVPSKPIGPPEDWASAAELVLLRLAATQRYLTTDDVWVALENQYPHLKPPHPTSAGSAMLNAARNGWIVKTSMTRPSISRVCHGRDKRIWQSLLHPKAQAQ